MREFLAIPLPLPLRRAIAEWSREIPLPPDRWRFVRDEGLHVTLRFLGEVDPASHSRLDAAWREAVFGIQPLTLRVCAAVCAPSARRPRIVWLPVRDASGKGTLAALASRIEEAARACGFPKEVRAFHGHVTLARARGETRMRSLELPGSQDLGDFAADRVVLYRSRLGAGGATYEELATYRLGEELSS